MVEVMTKFALQFMDKTGISDEVLLYAKYVPWILLALGVLLCLGGFRIYEICFSILLFMLFSYLLTVWLQEKASWGTIVSWFCTVGVFLAFLGLYWHRLGGCVICGLVGGTVAWILCHNIWISILSAIITVVSVWMFPVIIICLSTAVWGGWILFDVMNSVGWNFYALPIAIGFGVIGFVVQLLWSRHQTKFKKIYPTFITYKIEQRKRGKHANHISERN